MLNMYQEIVMDHYKNPRNRGVVESPCFTGQERNSSCGDEISCSGTIINDQIEQIRFEGKGCVISQATASLLSEKILNCSLQAIHQLNKDDITELLGVVLGPVRMQCGLLSLHALQKSLIEYSAKK